MKQFVAWVINWPKKIKNSLSAKLFLTTFIVLMSIFSASFLAVRTVLPTLYRREFFAEFYRMVDELNDAFESEGFVPTALGELVVTTLEEAVEFEYSSIRDREGEMRPISESLSFIIYSYALENNLNVGVFEVLPGGNMGGNIFRVNAKPATSHDAEIISANLNFYSIETGGFVVNVNASMFPIDQAISIINRLYVFVLMVTFFVSIGVSYAYSRYLAKPIVELSAVSKKMRELDLNQRHESTRSDEIGELSDTLNQMAAKLSISLSDLQAANVRLREDIERERKQEAKRRGLFTAISHELKTPITILKGEIGGMIDQVGIFKDRDTYLQSAYQTTETLGKLVSEILAISQLESHEFKLNFREEDIGDLVRGVCQRHEDLAESRKTSLTYYCEENVMARVDKEQFQMAISNVINNAISHSIAGAMVDVQLSQLDDRATLTVENSGVQIQQEDLESIFEAFYRSEKSRNRHTGGSGLGLFIVKNILDLHQFDYSIANSEEGVLFTLQFPI